MANDNHDDHGRFTSGGGGGKTDKTIAAARANSAFIRAAGSITPRGTGESLHDYMSRTSGPITNVSAIHAAQRDQATRPNSPDNRAGKTAETHGLSPRLQAHSDRIFAQMQKDQAARSSAAAKSLSGSRERNRSE